MLEQIVLFHTAPGLGIKDLHDGDDEIPALVEQKDITDELDGSRISNPSPACPTGRHWQGGYEHPGARSQGHVFVCNHLVYRLFLADLTGFRDLG